MARGRADRALISIVAVIATTALLTACNPAETTPATFDFQPVATPAPASTVTSPASTTTTARLTTTTLPPTTTTTEAPTTTGTFRVISNAAPATPPATPPATTTTTVTTATTLPPTTTTVAAPTTTVAASQGWITVLASLSTVNYSRAEAAAWRVELGIADAELLLSNDYSSLTPGYWVLYRGPYRHRAAASGVCGSYRDLVPGCYPAPLTLAG